MINKKWFRAAKKESEKSEYKLQVGAVVIKGGSLISSGYNEVRYCSVGSIKYTKFKESLHAERSALSKMNKEDVSGCSIYIYREGVTTKKPAMSKPCPQCFHMIKELGIKKIYFTVPYDPYFEIIKL